MSERPMEPADLGHHISRRFNEDLEKVRTRVLQMGGFVEQQLQHAVTALVEGDSRLGEEVAHADHQVNQMEVSIDEECDRPRADRRRGREDRADRLAAGQHRAALGQVPGGAPHRAPRDRHGARRAALLRAAQRGRGAGDRPPGPHRGRGIRGHPAPEHDLHDGGPAQHHAKNICEYIVYTVYGKDIRHLSLEDAEAQIRASAADRKA